MNHLYVGPRSSLETFATKLKTGRFQNRVVKFAHCDSVRPQARPLVEFMSGNKPNNVVFSEPSRHMRPSFLTVISWQHTI